MEITEIIRDACDKRLCTCSVYLGLKKVFDTVSYSILLAKPNHYGVRGVADDWIRSLIYNRIQYIIVNNTSSELSHNSWNVTGLCFKTTAVFDFHK